MQLNLLVIRSTNPQKLADFYTQLGLRFKHHQHGSGPMHYSANCNGLVFEIYPLQKPGDVVGNSIRLGFSVGDLYQLWLQLRAQRVTILEEPKKTPYGYKLIVQDFEGRKIELVEA